MKPDVLEQIKMIDEQRKKDEQQHHQNQHQQQPQTIMLQEPGKEPVAIGLQEAVNIVNQQNEQIRKLISHSQELERMVQQLQNKIISLEQTHETTNKSVSFSVPLEKPSISVQTILKQKDLQIAELKSELQKMKNNQQDSVEMKMTEPTKISQLPDRALFSDVFGPIKERSKLEPEFMIKI
jgi:hypothetical protein